jgi:hypothetical protein
MQRIKPEIVNTTGSLQLRRHIMATKFEKLIEYVIANDEKKARSLFHQIVVDKSRKIYEALDVDDTERAFDDVEADHTASGEMDGMDELGGDEADDLQSDVFVDGAEEGLGMGEEGADLNPEIDDRVADLESEFDALKAEFEQLLHADEAEEESEEEGMEEEGEGLEDLESAVDEHEGEEEHVEDEVEEGEGEEAEEEAAEEDKEEPVDESVIREYVLKVTQGLANDSEEGFVQKKSPVSAKPSIVPGISAKNLNQGGTSEGRPNPKSGEMIGDKEVVNRPGRKTVELKPTPKPVTSKEEGSVNKKSIES